jgi:metallo-beta-lactamase class B
MFIVLRALTWRLLLATLFLTSPFLASLFLASLIVVSPFAASPFAASLLVATPIGAQQSTPATAEWNQPVEPFKIIGNLYYVGASDVTSYAIATPQGIILIDTGFRETVPLIKASLEKLGFKLDDVRLLLTLHAHYDHVGGLAEIKALSHARFYASPGDAPLFERGGKQDFAFGDRFYFPPIKPDALLHDGETVSLGGTQLTAHFTPGHTKGGTSWTTTIRDGARDYHVVFASSLSTPGYQLVNNPKYPTIVSDLESSIAKLRALPCDIFLSQHGSQFDLTRRLEQRIADPSHNPFVDPDGYRRFLDGFEANLRKTVAAQQASGPQAPPPKN